MSEKSKISQEEEFNILEIVQTQIVSFDNKAGVLVSILGIIFGLSLSFLDVLARIKSLENIDFSIVQRRYVTFGIFYLAFVAFALLSILLAILVIVPRKHHEIEKKNINYYGDLKNMTYEDFHKNGTQSKDFDHMLFNQIKINSDICYKKHFFLKASIFSLIPFALLLITLVIMAVFFTL